MSAENKTIPALDGLRGFACLMVMFSHAGFKGWFYNIAGAGQLGVMLFFALSGFLMGHLYLPGQATWRYWAAFLIRRFFRIYPLFMLALAARWLVKQSIGDVKFRAYSYNDLLQHALLLKSSTNFWTIVIEMKFYAAFCLLACALLILKRKPQLMLCAWIGLWLAALYMPANFNRLSLLPYLPHFIGGIMAALLYRREILRKKLPAHAWDGVFFLCAIAILFFIPRICLSLTGQTIRLWRYSAIFSPLMSLTVLSAASAAGFAKAALSHRFMRFTGRISYSLYLIHFPLFIVLHDYVGIPSWCGLIVNFMFAFLAAWLLYNYIETLGNTLGKRLANKLIAA